LLYGPYQLASPISVDIGLPFTSSGGAGARTTGAGACATTGGLETRLLVEGGGGGGGLAATFLLWQPQTDTSSEAAAAYASCTLRLRHIIGIPLVGPRSWRKCPDPAHCEYYRA
jgi:hypothetical protein